MLTKADYDTLHYIMFQDDYPGYKPNVIEAPNRDGKLDSHKRYAHIATKYLNEYKNAHNRRILRSYLDKGHKLALEVYNQLSIPVEFKPDIERSALRILEYPPGSITHPHCDFNLFTLSLYRNLPECFRYTLLSPPEHIRKLNQQIHYGELMKEIGIADPSEHEVIKSNETQYSIVYFVIPAWESMLPSGETVGVWLDRNIKLARYDK